MWVHLRYAILQNPQAIPSAQTQQPGWIAVVSSKSQFARTKSQFARTVSQFARTVSSVVNCFVEFCFIMSTIHNTFSSGEQTTSPVTPPQPRSQDLWSYRHPGELGETLSPRSGSGKLREKGVCPLSSPTPSKVPKSILFPLVMKTIYPISLQMEVTLRQSSPPPPWNKGKAKEKKSGQKINKADLKVWHYSLDKRGEERFFDFLL